MKADLGGTELEAVLESTFALAQTTAGDVLVVMDGEANAIEQRFLEPADEIRLEITEQLLVIEMMTPLEGMTAHAWPEG